MGGEDGIHLPAARDLLHHSGRRTRNLPDRAPREPVPRVEIGVAVVEGGIVQIQHPEIEVVVALAERGAEIVLGVRERVPSGKCQPGLAEPAVLHAERHAVVQRLAAVRTAVDVAVLRILPAIRVRIPEIHGARAWKVLRID